MTVTDTQTMILRFRDLVTSPGGTIKSHREIVEDKGSVWWGWWSKTGERVPFDVFSELKVRAREDGLDVLLFDSGRLQLLTAKCTDIEWDNTRARIVTPDVEATPDYYNAQEYFCWFKFEELTDVPVESPREYLRQYSYVEVNEFFNSGPSRYTPFYGKRVVSLAELRQQDRTIWFIRDAKDGDPDNEIELLSANRLVPAHFPKEFTPTDSTKLLWMSDLHFGNQSFPSEDSASSDTLALRIAGALEDQEDLGGVIVSGDLTWRAKDEEFEHAGKFLNSLGSFTRVTEPYQIAACPGNHDVLFSSDPADKTKEVEHAGEDSRRAYAAFYNRLFYQKPNEFLSSGRRFLLAGAVPLEVVCLNSSLLQQSEGVFQGHGFVGARQLEDAAQRMGWKEDAPVHPIRIVVVHHHIVPVTFREVPMSETPYSVVLDAEALVRWIIRYRVKVVLHGHMHQPFHTQIVRTEDIRTDRGREHSFHVLGMGSTGVHRDYIGEEPHNMFGLLEFSPHCLTVTYRSVHKVNPPTHIQTVRVHLDEER